MFEVSVMPYFLSWGYNYKPNKYYKTLKFLNLLFFDYLMKKYLLIKYLIKQIKNNCIYKLIQKYGK